MSDATDVQKQLKPWQWPGEWVKDEKFWRDVASRAAAGLIVVFIGYLVAVASGLLGLPDLRKVLAVTLVFAAAIITFLPIVFGSRKLIGAIRNRIQPRWLSIMLMASWGLMYFGLMLIWLVIFLNLSKWGYEAV